jgi:hypothetical protein
MNNGAPDTIRTCESLDGIFVGDGPLEEQVVVGGAIPFSGGSSNGGFWSWKVKNALSFNES